MLKNDTDRKLAIYNMLNAIDDRREKLVKASSTGRHEPSSMYGGLYDIEEVDDGGRLIERNERGGEDAFVPVAELSSSASIDDIAPTGKKPVDTRPVAQTRSNGSHLPVIRRRGTTIRPY